MRSRLTVLLVNYNQKDDITECVASLYASTYRPAQIIVSDNGSTDGSLAVIRSQFPEVRVMENGANIGFAEANNRAAISLVPEDDYLLLLNSDTVVPPGTLAKLMHCAEKTGFDILGPKICYHDRPGIVWFAGGFFDPERCTFYHRHQNMEDDGVIEAVPCDFITGCALLMKASLFIALSGFDGRFFMYCEDLDLCIRARRLAKTIGCVSEPVIYHKIHDRGLHDARPLGRYYHNRNMLHTVKRTMRDKKASYTRATLRCIARALRIAAHRPLIGFASLCGIVDFAWARKGRCGCFLEAVFRAADRRHSS